ncbi:hypothetical protein [Sporomusa sp.]|uniref:hypothetical protein n=1 Tax=Sporomusa sp. TaxID=2078658 RepID=UPI002C1F8AB7|nr:hypothetical protein [Sporomusa sp.]HWR43993.1 hypothetical protein [Sporomusa sp.]
MTNHRKILFCLTGIFIAVLIAIIIALLTQGRHEYAQNIAVKACVWVIYTFIETKYSIEIKNTIRALVMAMLISDSFLGLYVNLYATSTIFDKIQHVFGSYAFSLFAYNLICQITKPVISRTFSFIFVISLGLSVGVFYEIGEFIGDLIAKPSVPSQPSLLDTNLDLVADVIGSLIAAVHTASIFPSSVRQPAKIE